MSHVLAPSIVIVIPIEERPYTVAAVLDDDELARVEAWIASSPRIRELVDMARELEEGDS